MRGAFFVIGLALLCGFSDKASAFVSSDLRGFRSRLIHHGSSYWNSEAEAIRLMHEDWDRSYAKKKLAIHIIHREAAILTRNALMAYPPERRPYVAIVATSPSAYIPKELCHSVTHLVSSSDVVPLFDRTGRELCNDTVVELQVQPGARTWDYDPGGPTYLPFLIFLGDQLIAESDSTYHIPPRPTFDYKASVGDQLILEALDYNIANHRMVEPTAIYSIQRSLTRETARQLIVTTVLELVETLKQNPGSAAMKPAPRHDTLHIAIAAKCPEGQIRSATLMSPDPERHVLLVESHEGTITYYTSTNDLNPYKESFREAMHQITKEGEK